MWESFCALCGVPFGVSAAQYDGRLDEADVAWTSSFIALKQRSLGASREVSSPKISPSWHLTKVGSDLAWGGVGHVPLERDSQASRRNSIKENTDPEESEEVVAFSNRGGEQHSDSISFPMHPVCWSILEQNYSNRSAGSTLDLAVLAKIFKSQLLDEKGRGFQPDWSSIAYGGAEELWSDGLGWMDIFDNDLDYHDIDPEDMDFLVRDPGHIQGFEDLILHPPLLSSTSQPQQRVISSKSNHDVFTRIPKEIRMVILCLLPTASVTALRLASKSMATLPLTQTYWRSRFQFPLELTYASKLLSFIKVEQGSEIDWKSLCNQLFHPNVEDPDFQWLKNRDRISHITSELAEKIIRNGPTISKSKNHKDLEASETFAEQIFCHRRLSCNCLPIGRTSEILFDDNVCPTNMKKISVLSVYDKTNEVKLVTGISFYAEGDEVHLDLGICKKGRDKHIQDVDLEADQTFCGFVLAMIDEGIIGLQVVVKGPDGGSQILKPTAGVLENDGQLVGFGRIVVEANELRGFRAELSKKQKVVSLSMIESQYSAKPLLSPEAALSSKLWVQLPPPEIIVTSQSGWINSTKFNYAQPAIFASNENMANSLVRVTAYVVTYPAGFAGLRFHFKNGTVVPEEKYVWGTDLDFLIDGPGGERIVGVDVAYSQKHEYLGVNLLTNKGRQSPFRYAMDEKEIYRERQMAPQGLHIVGMFTEFNSEHNFSLVGCGQSFGLLCMTGPPKIPSIISFWDPPKYDDYFNLWTTDDLPPSITQAGEVVGMQARHGFASWIDFTRPIKSITAGLQFYGSKLRGDPLRDDDLMGLKVNFGDGTTTLLGRHGHTKPESIITLDQDDEISEITVSVFNGKELQEIVGIEFSTKKGAQCHTLGGSRYSSSNQEFLKITLKSTSTMKLVGIIWAFDLGHKRSMYQGIQGLYRSQENSMHSAIPEIYPSLKWKVPPPQNSILRPIPSIHSDSQLESSWPVDSDNGDLSYMEIICIKAYFNSFLQGVQFIYKGGGTRKVGNLIGAVQSWALDEEVIVSVQIQHQQQSPFFNTAWPRDVAYIEGISFGLAKQTGGRSVRFTPYFGCPKTFGPFINSRLGLWEPDGSDIQGRGLSSRVVTDIQLKPGQIFRGLYAESIDTLMCCAGVIISESNETETTIPHLLSRSKPASVVYSGEDPPIAQLDSLSPPWLGAAPPDLDYQLPVGRLQGAYRIFCPLPDIITHLTIYRTPSGQDMRLWPIVGLEFHSTEYTTLLGFRTLSEKRTEKIAFSINRVQITGLAISSSTEKEKYPTTISEGWFTVQRDDKMDDFVGVTRFQLLTNSHNSTKDGFEVLHKSEGKNILGVYALYGEAINAIGLVQQ